MHTLLHQRSHPSLIHFLFLFSSLLFSLCSSSPSYPCRFAPLFSSSSLYSNSSAQSSFLDAIVEWEANFLSSSGVDVLSCVTRDGARIDIDSGRLIEQHQFTAPSKEGIHIALIIKCLLADSYACALLYPQSSFHSASSDALAAALDDAVRTLAGKVNSYELFHLNNPSFGGFLPWVTIETLNSTGSSCLRPTDAADESLWLPSLDNGENMWPIVILADLLQRKYPSQLHEPLNLTACIFADSVSNATEYYNLSPHEFSFYTSPSTTLAARWALVVERFKNNLFPIFYAGSNSSAKGFVAPGAFRSVSSIIRPLSPGARASGSLVDKDNYYCVAPCGTLNDPYEGELFTVFAYLLLDWSVYTADAPQSLWSFKRPQLRASLLKAPYIPNGSIIVQEGFWYSSHEQWKYLFLPYQDEPINGAVFINGEIARTQYSAHAINSGGLFGSVNGVCLNNSMDGGYHPQGVPPLASQPLDYAGVWTGYGCLPLFLASPAHAFVWYHAFISLPSAQNIYGATEGVRPFTLSPSSPAGVAPYVTWDTKLTTVLAMRGGLVDEVRAWLMGQGVYEQFINIVAAEWGAVFGDSPATSVPFAFPPPLFGSGNSSFYDHQFSSCTTKTFHEI